MKFKIKPCDYKTNTFFGKTVDYYCDNAHAKD